MTTETTQVATPRTIPSELDSVIVKFHDGNQVVARCLRAMKNSSPCLKYKKRDGGWAKRRSRIFGVSGDGTKIMVGFFNFRAKRWKRWWVESNQCILDCS